ncbi:MAG: C45 family autoproteolytic acyltransferase/hydrolase [Eubacteriales bacterium]|nr:C45 family autoproteolytic acyltransferase/hydrolase [Eubacteriales bacterium]
MMFWKIAEEGTVRQIGQGRGRLLARSGMAGFFTARELRLPPEEYERRRALFEKWCPGIPEELDGMAGEMGVLPGQLAQYALTYGGKPAAHGACSQLAVLPERSADGHLYLARSYEYDTQDETVLCATRAAGRYAHVGFSLFQSGRFDGMNEKGLCVTIGTCAFLAPAADAPEGFDFMLVVRALLDGCANVKEALDYLDTVPLCTSTNFMLADASGQCVAVETLATAQGTLRARRRAAQGWLLEVNHYQAPELAALVPQKPHFSTVRVDAVQTFFDRHDKVSADDLKGLLATRVPNGLCSHAYSGKFGTLHSMLFDVTASRLEVCLGAPDEGQWMQVDWNAPVDASCVQIPITDEVVPENFW